MTGDFSTLTCEKCHGSSRPDPHGTRISRATRIVTGRIGKGLKDFKTSRVGSGRVRRFSTISRVGSGRVRRFSKSRGSVGSGRVKTSRNSRGSGRVGSGRVGRTRPAGFDPTREKPWYFADRGIYSLSACGASCPLMRCLPESMRFNTCNNLLERSLLQTRHHGQTQPKAALCRNNMWICEARVCFNPSV